MASLGGGYLDVDPLIRKVKGGGMVNRILQQICGGEGLNKYGVKAELQQRIIDSESVLEG
jgi:E3 SUMO-protein ligase PIAS1